MTNSKRKTVDTVPWPRGAFEVTEAEYNAAKSARGSEDCAAAWQVLRYCYGWSFHGDSGRAEKVKAWLTKYRAAADISTDAKFDALRAALA